MKVAILGMATGWQDAPWGDPAWERWWLNDAHVMIPKGRTCTAWWELHGDTPLTRDRRPANHFEVIKAMDIPVYYLHGDPPTPNAIKLNIDELAAVGRDYFACTFAYQIAHAMKLGATEIALYGVALQTNREIVVERPCVAYWLGLAEGRGITVSSHLLHHPYRYALDDENERRWSMYAAMKARESISAWLPREAKRLGLAEEVDGVPA